MTTARKLLEALVVTCGPLAFLVLETAPKVRFVGLGG
jgi:hypothetical protein